MEPRREVEWEVARAKGLAARVPVAVGKAGSADLLAAVQEVLRSGSALLVTRTDWTLEARREKWESEFYDWQLITKGSKAGQKRRVRRYRKTDIERQWEQFYADLRRDARSDRSNRKQGNIECGECGDKWSRRTPSNYRHVCPGGGVVPTDEGDG